MLVTFHCAPKYLSYLQELKMILNARWQCRVLAINRSVQYHQSHLVHQFFLLRALQSKLNLCLFYDCSLFVSILWFSSPISNAHCFNIFLGWIQPPDSKSAYSSSTLWKCLAIDMFYIPSHFIVPYQRPLEVYFLQTVMQRPKNV
jgi:hypothetical protein